MLERKRNTSIDQCIIFCNFFYVAYYMYVFLSSNLCSRFFQTKTSSNFLDKHRFVFLSENRDWEKKFRLWTTNSGWCWKSSCSFRDNKDRMANLYARRCQLDLSQKKQDRSWKNKMSVGNWKRNWNFIFQPLIFRFRPLVFRGLCVIVASNSRCWWQGWTSNVTSSRAFSCAWSRTCRRHGI